jgi:hypothetical protein
MSSLATSPDAAFFRCYILEDLLANVYSKMTDP